MMAGPRGYSSYHGGRNNVWKVLAAILLILVILAAAGFMLLQKYLVYGEDGKPHLQLPQDTPAADTSSVSSANAGASGSSADEPLNIVIDEPEVTKIFAQQLTDLPLTDWTAASAKLAVSSTTLTNAVCLTVKDASGSVYYDSAAAAALGSGAVKAQTATAAAIASMTGSSTYTIARLSCFLDPIASNADLDGKGLKNTGGYIFYDGSNQNWMDPAKPAARQYLVSLAKECAALGFDEILLTNVSYPTVGKLDKVDYGATALNENLSTFLTEVKAALKDTGVKVSVELPAAVITSGSDVHAGQNLGALATLVDGIYTVTTAADAPALAAAVQTVSASTALIPEVSAIPAPGFGSYLLTQ